MRYIRETPVGRIGAYLQFTLFIFFPGPQAESGAEAIRESLSRCLNNTLDPSENIINHKKWSCIHHRARLSYRQLLPCSPVCLLFYSTPAKQLSGPRGPADRFYDRLTAYFFRALAKLNSAEGRKVSL